MLPGDEIPRSYSVQRLFFVSACFIVLRRPAACLGIMDHDVEKASSHTAGPEGSPRQSLSRSRSHNGYGVSDDAPHTPPSPNKEEDYIAVGWDGGDADPLCPRSFTKARKWIITWLLSMGSFTVYVYISMTA